MNDNIYFMIKDIVKNELLKLMLMQHINNLCSAESPLSGEPVRVVIRRIIAIPKKEK